MKVVYAPPFSEAYSFFSTVRLSKMGLPLLTPGKIYDVIKSYNKEKIYTYNIIDDFGNSRWYDDDFLIPLEQYREAKLNEIGI
jgi:hypothetical protein